MNIYFSLKPLIERLALSTLNYENNMCLVVNVFITKLWRYLYFT